MRRVFQASALIAAALLAAQPAFPFSLGSLLSPRAPENFKLIHVPELVRLMNDRNARAYVFDADPLVVRESEGVIPGARLLSSYDGYDVAAELPPDRNAKLIFYCHNPR